VQLTQSFHLALVPTNWATAQDEMTQRSIKSDARKQNETKIRNAINKKNWSEKVMLFLYDKRRLLWKCEGLQ